LLADDPRVVAVSGVFLYVAIVAIWAFVLVPRWLRRHHAQPHSLAQDDAAIDASLEACEGAGSDGDAESCISYPADQAEPASEDGPGSRLATMTPEPLPRSRLMQARRRLLTVLVLLAAAVGAAAASRLIPWWTFGAPAGVLVCYLLLLRTAARADAEHARHMAALHAREARIQAARARAAVASEPDAQIIDISGRVGDQLYDQYADATVRAVGD
jgi:hypothetical protein